MIGKHTDGRAVSTSTAMDMAVTEICALVDKAYAEGVDEGYGRGFEDGRQAIRWWEVLLYLSCAFAFFVCGAFWLGRYFQ